MDISTEELENFLAFSPVADESTPEAADPSGEGSLVSMHRKQEEQYARVDAFWDMLKSNYNPAVHGGETLEQACTAEMEFLFHLGRNLHPLSASGQAYLLKAMDCRKQFEKKTGLLVSRISGENMPVFSGLLTEDLREDIQLGRFDAIGALRDNGNDIVCAGTLVYELNAVPPENELVMLIRWLYVDEDWRSRGVANALLGELAARMAAFRISALQVDIPAAAETSQIALDFFRAWHFTFTTGIESELVVSLKDITTTQPYRRYKKDARRGIHNRICVFFNINSPFFAPNRSRPGLSNADRLRGVVTAPLSYSICS